MKAQWFWYMAGAVLTLVWKWQKYCYESKGKGIPFWKASREWWELETLGSKVSWGATIGGVWLLGSVLIEKKGAEWLAGGVLMNVPVFAPLSFFIGSIAELVIPEITKWIVKKCGG